ncbi:MAG: tRNA-binding protein [Sphingobacterium sp.]|uniref:tRNA-binding protein n=1 Tax=Sphingobacterium sp. JB170 TaxID=1434842 RepID=UPI000B35526A|nr:tRNA-binding protein [Sphingobacterium sp. JB170]
MGREISWEDFHTVDLRVGTIIQVDDFPQAHKPAYQLRIDFGDEVGVLKSSAQITYHYKKDELMGKQVVGVVNFSRKQIASFMSECLITGFADDEGHIVLTAVERQLPNGSKLI